jgi:hypothetical protein
MLHRGDRHRRHAGFPVLLPADAMAAYEVRTHTNALEALALSVGRITTVDELVSELAAASLPAAAPPAAASGRERHPA